VNISRNFFFDAFWFWQTILKAVLGISFYLRLYHITLKTHRNKSNKGKFLRRWRARRSVLLVELGAIKLVARTCTSVADTRMVVN
jgi:hypothetical protein